MAEEWFYGYRYKECMPRMLQRRCGRFIHPQGRWFTGGFQGGDAKFGDMNNDKIIDENDMVVLGGRTLIFTVHSGTSLLDKRFTLSTLFTFVSGNEIYNYTRSQLEGMTNVYNQTNAVRKRVAFKWPGYRYPKATWGDPMGNARFSSRWIEDGHTCV